MDISMVISMGIWMIQDFLRLQITVVPLGAPQTWPSNSIGVTNPNGRGSKWSPRNSIPSVPSVPSVPSQNSPNLYVVQNCCCLLWFPLTAQDRHNARKLQAGVPLDPWCGAPDEFRGVPWCFRPWPLPDFRQASWNPMKFNIWTSLMGNRRREG